MAAQPNDDSNSNAGQKKDIKFLQLYTSKSYKNRRNDLLRPASEDNKAENRSSSEEITKHVLSPKLVNAISNTAQVVWANCNEREGGLLGRSDMRLQTAVGMPVAMDADGNMCIVVMFSPNNVQSNTDAVEYLKSLSEGATSTSIPCLLPVMDRGTKRLEYNPKRFSDWEEHEENDEAEKNRAIQAYTPNNTMNEFELDIVSVKEYSFDAVASCVCACVCMRVFSESYPNILLCTAAGRPLWYSNAASVW